MNREAEVSRKEKILASKVIKDGIDDMSLDYFDNEQYEALTMAIKVLEQESKTGHWIEEYIGCMYDVCSECGQKVTTGHFKYNFCPNCGARMVEPQESEDKE